ncbi:MAG: hypothetical protein ABEI31_06420 [Halodesulfurarchaeum sp.]
MRPLGRRALQVLVGLLALLVYGFGAYLGYQLLVLLWLRPPDPLTLLIAVGIATLLTGYLSYRLGTAQILSSVQVVPLTRDRARGIHRLLYRLVDRMEVERPELHLGSLSALHALSLGGAGSEVNVLARDVLWLLDVGKLAGILPHELAHLESHDVLVQTMAARAAQTVVGMRWLPFLPAGLLLLGARAWLRPDIQ